MQDDIYDEKFVASLFNRMSKTYGLANYISSFGFTERWRKQCVAELNLDRELSLGYDLMSGMGESWNLLHRATSQKHELVGVDISPAMNKSAEEELDKYQTLNIRIEEQNVLQSTLKTESADYIISTFGLKTFSDEQLKVLAVQTHRLLKRGGEFSFVEISKPNSRLLTIPYMFYLKIMIPIIGFIFMGNSKDYSMLGVYCEKFGDCSNFKNYLQEAGLEVEQKSYFFGCATGVHGRRR